MTVKIKRVYEPPEDQDGKRVLVDRLWPRGLSKQRAALHEWMKDIAPSDELRKWFGHRPERWEAFRESYLAELDGHHERLSGLAELCRGGTVTLVFAAKNENQNNAVVIREWIDRRFDVR